MNTTPGAKPTPEILAAKVSAIEILREALLMHMKKAATPAECNSKYEQVLIIINSRCGHEMNTSTIKLTQECDFNAMPIFASFIESLYTRLHAEEITAAHELQQLLKV